MSNFVRTFRARKTFLDRLEVGDSISRAAEAAGGKASNFRRWREADEDFAKDWDDAIEGGTDFIEDAATERAIEKSDALMAMILKARRPEKYDRGSRLEVSGTINVEGSKTKLLNRVARLQAAARESAAEVGEEAPQAQIEDGTRKAPSPKLEKSPDADKHGRPRGGSADQRGGRKKAAS